MEEQSAIAEYRREEDEATVPARMLTAWQAIVDESRRHGPIAIVSHGGPVRVLLEHFGVDHDELWHYRRQFDHQNPLPPCGIWAVTINGDEQPQAGTGLFTGTVHRYPN
ncbi:MAG: histidine phosphatase family protein [Caldilineaceae bacterium]